MCIRDRYTYTHVQYCSMYGHVVSSGQSQHARVWKTTICMNIILQQLVANYGMAKLQTDLIQLLRNIWHQSTSSPYPRTCTHNIVQSARRGKISLHDYVIRNGRVTIKRMVIAQLKGALCLTVATTHHELQPTD